MSKQTIFGLLFIGALVLTVFKIFDSDTTVMSHGSQLLKYGALSSFGALAGGLFNAWLNARKEETQSKGDKA
jgi:hypothetical protein